MDAVVGRKTQWKQIWQLISGIYYETPKDVVYTKLNEISNELLNGIKADALEPATKKSDENTVKSNCPRKLYQFIEKLKEFLNIEILHAWSIFCYYLIHEYRGSINTLTTYLSTESNMIKLLYDMWEFYTLERMIMLKIAKTLLVFYKSLKHPYNEEYKKIIDSLQLPLLRKSYIEQLELLIGETANCTNSEFFNKHQILQAHAERKLREINEILQILIIIIHSGGILPSEIKVLINVFKSHLFGRQQHQFLDDSNSVHKELKLKIMYNEIGIILKCFDVRQTLNKTWITDTINLLEKDIITMHQNVEHGPILLGWMMLQLNVINLQEDDENFIKCRQFAIKSVQLGVFTFLKKMICHPMYKDSNMVAKIVRQSIYNNLSRLCEIFDNDGALAQHNGIYDLLCELLSTSVIAKEFCTKEDYGCRSLLNTALENFPIDFISLSEIAYAISSTGIELNRKYIRNLLENLPIYSEHYNSENIQLKLSSSNENEFILMANYMPFNKINWTIPAGTIVLIKDNQQQQQTTIHFRITVNYFHILHNEINVLLSDTLKYTEINDMRKRRIVAGLTYLACEIKLIKNPNDITNEMVHPIEMVIDILQKFKLIQNPPIELLTKCFEVCSCLLPLFENEIFQRIITLQILPVITNLQLNYKSLSMGISFDSSLIGYYLVNYEKNYGRYDFLMSYLQFLKTYFKLSLNNVPAIELPGLIFILREIFPHIHSWRFECEDHRQTIYTQILEYFFDILQLTTEQLRNDKQRTVLRNVCAYSLLQLDNGMILLRFIAMGNAYLENKMQYEINWMVASQSGLNLIVQLSMTILMQILRLRNCIIMDFDANCKNLNTNNNHNILSPLETIIYTQPKQWDTLRIIPVVTSYMGNIFNRRLPILSCRLLRRFAIEFQMSLLACLDMEPDQIRLIFLQRLPNYLENDILKIAIIEFVDSCIVKQPGLTQAFFKINYQHEKRFLGKLIKSQKTYQITDGILTYMSEYLDVILKDPKTIVSPLLNGIMSLFHTLWKNNMQTLVKELLEKPDFWSSLTNILFCKNINNNIRAYSQLFNILSIEIYRTRRIKKNLDEHLKVAFEKFLNYKYFHKWVDNILDNIPEEGDGGDNSGDSDNNEVYNDNHNKTISSGDIENDIIYNQVPEWLSRLQSFKDLLTIIMRKKGLRRKKLHEIFLPNDSKKYILNKLLKIMVKRSQTSNDFRPFIIISELYLIIILSYKFKYTDDVNEDNELIEQIRLLLNSLAISYNELHARARESILSITFKIIDLLSNEIIQDQLLSSEFMRSISEILCIELTEIENSIRKDASNINNTNNAINNNNINNNNNLIYKKLSIILSINLLKKMAIHFIRHENDNLNWYGQIINQHLCFRILSCLNSTLQLYKTKHITIELLDLLIILSKGQCSIELINCSIMDYLWLKLLPPKELLQIQSSYYVPSAATLGTDLPSSMSTSSLTGTTGSTITSSSNIIVNPSIQNKWQTNDWWLIYAKGIQFITCLLQKHGYQVLSETISFVGIHEEYLVDSILLSKHTMDEKARILIKSTLELINELIPYEKEWRLEHQQSMINLMRCVQILLDHSVSLIYRPKILKRLMEGSGGGGESSKVDLVINNNQSDGKPDGGIVSFSVELIQPMNDLTEIIILCTKCLLVFSPKLIDLLTEIEFIPSQWQPLIEIQFGAPKLNVDSTVPQLTFGILLSAVGIFTKSLNLQQYEFEEIPLTDIFNKSDNDNNNLPYTIISTTIENTGVSTTNDDDCVDDGNDINTNEGNLNQSAATTSTINSRTPFLKSHSMTSGSGGTSTSLTMPSYEILTRLDTKLCVIALEYLLTLLASQSLLAIKDTNLSNREKQLIKRELSTEMLQFHDFVKKRILSLDPRGSLYRRKYGIRLIKNKQYEKKINTDDVIVVDDDEDDNDDDDDTENATTINEDWDKENIIMGQRGQQQRTPPPPVSKLSMRDSMRVNVMRKVHLTTQQQQQQQHQQQQLHKTQQSINPSSSTLSFTSNISPISGSTPQRTNLNIPTSTPMDQQYDEQCFTTTDNDESLQYLEPIEPTFTGLSYVNLVEEDYFHFLSNLFTVICQNE